MDFDERKQTNSGAGTFVVYIEERSKKGTISERSGSSLSRHAGQLAVSKKEMECSFAKQKEPKASDVKRLKR